MQPKSCLLLPPPDLANCIAAAIFRDTKGTDLTDADRLNYFPASPLHSLTFVLAGQLHISAGLHDIASLRACKPVAGTVVIPPPDEPIVSWSPGPVVALTIGFFPEAWRILGGGQDEDALPRLLNVPASRLSHPDEVEKQWATFCSELSSLWSERRASTAFANWPGSDKVADWSRHLLARLAIAGPGRSARAMERRLRRWTGQSRQSLGFYARIEELHRMRTTEPDAPLAALANDAKFSDQSHMGRAVKRATGFSPARLNRMIETDEPFWCYRLMGERF